MNHGSNSTYNNHGCRCDNCRVAHAAHQRQWRQKQLQRGGIPADVPHGSASTYTNYGCRCDDCTEAASYYGQCRRRAKRAAS